MCQPKKKFVFGYELAELVFIMILGSLLHFTFEFSGHQPVVGVFSAVNESVWEHLKLGFWPAPVYAIVECRYLKPSTNNSIFAKTVGIHLILMVITILFYFYTAILHISPSVPSKAPGA